MSKRLSKRLSTLILEGCKKDGPQVFGNFFKFKSCGDHKTISGTCALGAAYYAQMGEEQCLGHELGFLGKTPEDYVENFRRLASLEGQQIPKRLLASLPKKLQDEFEGSNKDYYCIRSLVIFLNDDKKWKRERIAKLLKKYGL